MPDMFTAGPTTSLMGAASLLRVNCIRSSSSVRAESVNNVLAANVWSRSAKAEPRLVAFNPPAFRAFSLSTS
jgi:hypothetical protein